MGTWGSNNFDNDTAGDFFLLFIERMVNEIRVTMRMDSQLNAGSYWSDVIPCMIEMVTVLVEQNYHCLALDAEELKRWKRIYMERWEDTIDDTQPQTEYRIERERILNETFDRLIALAGEN